MEEISKMQQKRCLRKCRKQGRQGEATHEAGSRCHRWFEKGRAIPMAWVGLSEREGLPLASSQKENEDLCALPSETRVLSKT